MYQATMLCYYYKTVSNFDEISRQTDARGQPRDKISFLAQKGGGCHTLLRDLNYKKNEIIIRAHQNGKYNRTHNKAHCRMRNG